MLNELPYTPSYGRDIAHFVKHLPSVLEKRKRVRQTVPWRSMSFIGQAKHFMRPTSWSRMTGPCVVFEGAFLMLRFLMITSRRDRWSQIGCIQSTQHNLTRHIVWIKISVFSCVEERLGYTTNIKWTQSISLLLSRLVNMISTTSTRV